MGILHNNALYMRMTTFISMEIKEECNKICSPTIEVQTFEDVLCTLCFYCTSNFGYFMALPQVYFYGD